MRVEPQIAFCVREVEPPGVEVRVNFGVFAGRGATPAEIDELAKVLLPKVGEVAIVAEHELDMLCGRLVEAAETWASSCIAERHAEVSEL
jgi:hypothetical protein